MANIQVAIINKSTVIKNAGEVEKVAGALQQQVTKHFAPIWGIDASLRIVKNGDKPKPGEWWLALLDNSDQAGALGYHDVTHEGLPLGKVFAKTDQDYGEQWSGTASHELLEMLADPGINLTVFDESSHGGRLFAYEVCDACEAEQFGYKIDGVLVSDFVYPSWFERFRGKGTQFDKSAKIKEAFQLLPGGYIGVYDIKSGGGWTQITADRMNFRARPPVGSRRERRTIPQPQRIASNTP